MSPSKSNIVNEIYDAFARSAVEDVLGRLHPDVEWTTPTTLPWSRGSYRGPIEVGEYFGSFAGMLDDASVEPEEILECGDRVVAFGHERARARPTGRRFDARFVHTWTLDTQGRVRAMHGLVDTAAIREAFEKIC